MAGEVDKEGMAEQTTYHFLQGIQSVPSTSLRVKSIRIHAAPSLLFGILTALSRRS